jgi:hypothetical protein
MEDHEAVTKLLQYLASLGGVTDRYTRTLDNHGNRACRTEKMSVLRSLAGCRGKDFHVNVLLNSR